MSVGGEVVKQFFVSITVSILVIIIVAILLGVTWFVLLNFVLEKIGTEFTAENLFSSLF